MGEEPAFYERWAQDQLNDPRRDAVLKWKAANLANLFLRSFPNEKVASIAEVGGAEGTLLNSVGQLLGAQVMVSYDVSAEFSETGRKLFPKIEFVHSEFTGMDNRQFDLIILSDITEHVENEEQLLHAVSESCLFILMKFPIEICLQDNDVVRMLTGRRKKENEKYGPQHYNGHLRGYTIRSARASIARYFSVQDQHLEHTLYFYGGPKRRALKKVLGTTIAVRLFGGAPFILGRNDNLAPI